MKEGKKRKVRGESEKRKKNEIEKKLTIKKQIKRISGKKRNLIQSFSLV